MSEKVDPKGVLPDLHMDFWAITTMVQLRGYVRIGGERPYAES